MEVVMHNAGHCEVKGTPNFVEVIRATPDPTNRFGFDLWHDGHRGWCVVVNGRLRESFPIKQNAIDFATTA